MKQRAKERVQSYLREREGQAASAGIERAEDPVERGGLRGQVETTTEKQGPPHAALRHFYERRDYGRGTNHLAARLGRAGDSQYLQYFYILFPRLPEQELSERGDERV